MSLGSHNAAVCTVPKWLPGWVSVHNAAVRTVPRWLPAWISVYITLRYALFLSGYRRGSRFT